MAGPKLTVIPDILEEHLEELAFLWGQRTAALRSPDYTPMAFQRLEDRIEAHVQGLLAGGERTIPLLKDSLEAEDAPVAFAAAYALLRLKVPEAAHAVAEAFRLAQEGQLEGIRQALCHGPIELVGEDLRRASTSPSVAIAMAASEALAVHARLRVDAKQLEPFLADEKAEVRQTAWRINSQLGLVRDQQIYEAAFNDKDAGVRRAALWSAGWTQQKWLPAACRSLASKTALENWDAVLLLAILGKPDELPRILGLGQRADLGPKRFQVLGAYGHPELVEELIRGMENPDLQSAVAAGAAFTKITGCDVESDQRVQLPPEDGSEPDEFEREFLDEAKLPDVRKAREHWSKVKSQMVHSTRICHGFDISQGASTEILDRLDMESRSEACLRGRFEGTWTGAPFDLVRFPQSPLRSHHG